MLCIFGFDDDKVIKDFIRLHVEKLPTEKICLNGSYPDYIFNNANVRIQYEVNPLLKSIQSILPYAYTWRARKALETSRSSIRKSLGKFFSKQGVDVMLAEFGDTGADVAPLAAELRIPLVVHFHGHDAHRKSIFNEDMLAKYKFMFHSASAILAVSKFMVQTLADLGCPKDKLIYNPYGPRDTFFSVTPNYQPTVLSVGRFTDIKANYLVIIAFQKVLESIPDAKLTMIGTGELLETCKTIASALSIEKQIEFKGAVNHSELPGYFENACCFAQHSVTPTYGDAEGTPNTILEASAAALPIVSTRHAGIPDIVQDNETGFLVEERDISGMAAHMQRLLADTRLCREIGKKARERVKRHFTSDAHILRLAEAIDHARTGNNKGIAELAHSSQNIGQD